MNDILGQVALLRRPRILATAARAALPHYRRDKRLRRLLGYGPQQATGPVVMRLIDMEGTLNDARRAGAPDYSVVRHVEVLTALLAETEALRVKLAA